jgi:hypothetical protein
VSTPSPNRGRGPDGPGTQEPSTSGQNNVTVNGGYHQYEGWARPGTAGAAGTADNSITVINGGPTTLLVSASTAVVFNGLSVHGTTSASRPARRSTAFAPSRRTLPCRT